VILPIDDKHRLASDSSSWMIQVARRRKGQISWQSIAYFGSLQSAVNELAALRLRTSNAQTLADALAEVERVTTSLVHALSPEFDVMVKPEVKAV